MVNDTMGNDEQTAEAEKVSILPRVRDGSRVRGGRRFENA